LRPSHTRSLPDNIQDIDLELSENPLDVNFKALKINNQITQDKRDFIFPSSENGDYATECQKLIICKVDQGRARGFFIRTGMDVSMVIDQVGSTFVGSHAFKTISCQRYDAGCRCVKSNDDTDNGMGRPRRATCLGIHRAIHLAL
jgi:hypothetical protein